MAMMAEGKKKKQRGKAKKITTPQDLRRVLEHLVEVQKLEERKDKEREAAKRAAEEQQEVEERKALLEETIQENQNDLKWVEQCGREVLALRDMNDKLAKSCEKVMVAMSEDLKDESWRWMEKCYQILKRRMRCMRAMRIAGEELSILRKRELKLEISQLAKEILKTEMQDGVWVNWLDELD